LELIIEVDHIFRLQGLELREQFKRLEENAVNLGAVCVGRAIMPRINNPTMGHDDFVETTHDVVRCEHVIATVSKEPLREDGYTVYFPMI
jgi:hypothetical protein